MPKKISAGTRIPKISGKAKTIRTEQLHRTQQLVTLGTLAAGIAHEIRNPLGVLAISLEGIARHSAADPALTDAIAHARESVDRINRIINITLDVAGKRNQQHLPIDLQDLVTQTVPFVSATVKGKSVTFHMACETIPLPLLTGDRGQLQQALINLLLNATDSIAASGTVSVLLRTQNVNRVPSIVLEISDNGSGIAKADQAKIFRTFFSRKPGGTGLGLAITRAIIEEHNAQISFESTAGTGTTFTITFPIRNSKTRA